MAVLLPGNVGKTVIFLQKKLKEHGYDVGPIDGRYGQKTKEAVTSYQQDNGLTIDGIAGSETLRSLGIQAVIDKPINGASDTPSWMPIAGLISGLLTLLFLMALVGASIFQYQIGCGAEFIVIAALSLGTALAFSFIGGTAAAKGHVPMPFAQTHPIEFAVGGGIAAFVLVMVFGTQLWNNAGCVDPAPAHEYSVYIHIANEDQRHEAIALKSKLGDHGYNVRETIENVGDAAPNHPDVRYYYEEDLDAAKNVKKLSAKGLLHNIAVNPKMHDPKKSELHTLLLYFPK